MSVWALADLHLAFGVPEKSMEVFRPDWEGYTDKIRMHWKRLVGAEDLVLLPGDISWAMRWEDALPDLEWIDALPGTKLMIRGNHDYWWLSSKKLREQLPPSLHFIHNTAFFWKGVAIGGTRLWETDEFSFASYIASPAPSFKRFRQEETAGKKERRGMLFNRELGRLHRSLRALDPTAVHRIAMTHYPPIGADLADSRISKILEAYRIDISVFGHLHKVKRELSLFGKKNRVRYAFSAADYLDFSPLLLLQGL